MLLFAAAWDLRPAQAQVAPNLQLPVIPATQPARRGIAIPPQQPQPPLLPGGDPFGGVIQPSEEATTLLQRSSEAIERQDWKLAIDSLQRVVELPGEHVLSVDASRYEAAGRVAQLRIATLPPQGLAAYRLVHDGEAAALLAKGIETHDEAMLRTVVDRYICSTPGDEAAVTLADWLMDEGRFSDAAGILQYVKEVRPDSQLAVWVIPGRLAVCASAIGQQERARQLWAEAQQRASTQPEQPAARESGRAGEREKGKLKAALTADRVKAINGYIARVDQREGNHEAVSWPVAMGNPERDARMPAVEPTFLDPGIGSPWTYTLVSEPKAGAEAVADYARRYGLFPSGQPVTDGQVIVAKDEAGLIALDVGSLSRLWTARKHREVVEGDSDPFVQQQVRFGVEGESRINADAQLRGDPLVRRLFHDTVGGGVTVAFGRVLTIEWPDEPPQVTPMVRTINPMQAMNFAPNSHPNHVAAYALETGEFLWRTDISTETAPARQAAQPAQPRPRIRMADPLKSTSEAEFLATPVPAGRHLLTTYRINSDLHAAVLDPQTGKVVRDVYLCGTGGGPFDSLAALEPCVADGVAFIPTGRGLLIALDLDDWSVRWAVRYVEPMTATMDRRPRLGIQPDGEGEADPTPGDGFLPTPPVAVADVVLLTPADDDNLLCFDRNSGKLRWKAPAGRSRYLLAADDRHVWLAGRQLQMLEVDGGRQVWTRTAPDPIGRGCLTGGRLMLPTIDGPLVLAAATGEEVKLDPARLPLDPPHLGNLLAWGGALYSLSPFAISKHPDMGKAYERAVARHKSASTDAATAIQLASLELLKHAPSKALAALAGVREVSSPGINAKAEADGETEGARDGETETLTRTKVSLARRQYEQVLHLRVRAMLESVAAGEVKGQAALDMLTNAHRVARQAGSSQQAARDGVESSLALGDYLEKSGAHLLASLQYLTLVLAPEGDELMPAESGTQRRARSLAIQKILDVSRDFSPEDRQKLESAIRERYTVALGQQQPAMLWLAESEALTEQSHDAELALGQTAADELRFEAAESYFDRAIRRADRRELVAAATARLAALYLQPDELHQPVSAAKLLDKLAHDLGGIDIPRDVLTPGGASQPAGGAVAMAPAGQIAQRLRAGIDSKRLIRGTAALTSPTITAIGQTKTRVLTSARPLCVRGDRTEPMAEITLHYLEGNKLEARSVADGRLLWPAELRLLTDPAVEPKAPEAIGQFPGNNRSDYQGCARGVLSGQTLILNSDTGLHAVGLLTGRRLWSRRFDPPVTATTTDGGPSDSWLWAHDDYVISVDAQHHLDVAHASQGDRLLWRCTNPERRWAAVRARGAYVVAVDSRLEHLDVFRLADGRNLGQVNFRQDAASTNQVSITLYDQVVCGPAGEGQVIGVELAAPGVERWRARMPDSIAQLFKPSPDLLAIADRAGNVRILEPATGKKVIEARVPSCTNGILGGSIDGGVLYVYGLQNRATDPREYDKQQWTLAAINMGSGALIWEKTGLAARTFFSGEVMRAAKNAIPLASFVPAGASAAQPDVNGLQAGAVRLTLIDKTSGLVMGEPVTVELKNDSGASRILDVQVWPEQVLVAAGSSYVSFGTAPAGKASGGTE